MKASISSIFLFQIHPVGKLVFSEKLGADSACSLKKESAARSSQSKPSAKRQFDDECSPSGESLECDSVSIDSCGDSDEEVRQPVASNRCEKNLDEQKFTIETTVTVEKRGDRKKSKKCLPLVPQEPSPFKDRKKKSTKSDELNWMKC